MERYDIVVLGASAGGVEALQHIASKLPRDFPASIFIVLHIPAQSPSYLPQILSRAGPLPAVQPKDGQKIEKGKIYVAGPDCHLLVHEGYVRMVRGPNENRHRPAVDPLFRSAAAAYGNRVVGVVLTGSLDDGTSGLQAIKRSGGIAIVQDPGEALYPSMPKSALENVEADYVRPLDGIVQTLIELAGKPVKNQEKEIPEDVKLEAQIAANEKTDEDVLDRLGRPSRFACPECHGTLWEIDKDNVLRFRCRVGHAFSIESLLSEQSNSLEETLWAALRALEESASMAQRLAKRAHLNKQPHSEKRFTEKAKTANDHAETMRKLLTSRDWELDADVEPPA